MNGTIELIRNRVSLRNYAPRPITPEHLDLILESAMLAPTAGNMVVCFGYYPAEKRPQPRSRFDRRFIVFTDTYQRLSKEDFEEMFTGWDAKFNAGNRFAAKNVGQETYARKTGAEFSREMARSVRKALEAWKGRELQQSEPQ